MARDVRRFFIHQEAHRMRHFFRQPHTRGGDGFQNFFDGYIFIEIYVSIKPGATQLTVILRFASSTAKAFAAPIKPALDAL